MDIFSILGFLTVVLIDLEVRPRCEAVPQGWPMVRDDASLEEAEL
jgi:hypothetical protein